MRSKIETILCTGRTGSIGSYMPEEVIPLHTRLEATTEDMKMELATLSLSRWALVHLAALVNVQACERNPQLAWSLNTDGAAKWFRAACEANCEHFVFVSSSHVFSSPKDIEPLTPASAVGPASVYGKTKLAAETVLRALAVQYPDTKLTIARVFSVISDAMRPGFLLTALHQRARHRDLSPIPGLSHIRDFLEAPEICRRLVKLARNACSADLVLICSGTGRPIREIAESVFAQYDIDPTLLRESPVTTNDVPYLVGVPSQF